MFFGLSKIKKKKGPLPRPMFPEQIEVSHFKKAAGHPAHGVAKTHGKRRIADKAAHDKKVNLADEDKGKEHDDHWRN